MIMSEKKILIIDDEIDFVRIMSAHLKARGYSTVSASDAVGAIMVAQRENPDFIILDVRMPAGDGFTVMERLAKFDRTSLIPVAVVTGKMLSGKQRAMAEGAVGFFTKPVDFDKLLTLIDDLLGRPVGAGEGEQKESVYSLPESYNLDE
jgi:two-component system NtrC family response regulator/two-component system response regulator AtoC